jgi:DNA-binding PadR family transcriptional regulator
MPADSLSHSGLSYAILGLIRDQPGSGYEIRRVFDTPLLRRFSSSPGSIYPALKRLEQLGLVERTGSRNRGTFSITPEGRAALTEWVMRPISPREIEEEADLLLLRFAFLEGLVSPASRLDFLSSFAAAAEELFETLSDDRQSMDRTMPVQALLTLDYRIAMARAHVTWTEHALRELGLA